VGIGVRREEAARSAGWVTWCFLISAVGFTCQSWEKRKDPTCHLTLGEIDLTQKDRMIRWADYILTILDVKEK